MKLCSLFDGSGGFPLAGSLCGIDPISASEVEPYPIAVTRSRFPRMKHLGNVSKVNGAEIKPVDVITFGSPCQDLSVAGKRAGLKHEENGDEETTRSGLFKEAIRIIKEMREATNGKYPTFALWENVPGAFSSNKGEDFRIVLEEFIKIVEPSAEMPAMPKGGWPYADVIMGDGWSVAYRTLDAQYWGVPQRRKRIYLVADFRGERAHKVLFEREGVRGYFTQSRAQGQGTPTDAQGCIAADDRAGAECISFHLTQDPITSEKASPCISSGNPVSGQCTVGVCVPNFILDDQGGQQINVRTDGKSPTLRAETHGNLPCVLVYDARGNGDGKTVNTLTGDHENRVTDYTSVICLQGNGIDRADTAGCNGKGWNDKTCYTLNTIDRPAVAYQDKIGSLCARDYKGVVSQYVDEDKCVVAYGFYPQMKAEGIAWTEEKAGCLVNGTNPGFQNGVCITEPQYIVRRLTPTECARLQGFADKWGHIEPKDDFTDEEYKFWLEGRNTHAEINGKAVKDYTKAQMLTWYNKLHTDSSEYKMWGNGIALPNALYVMQGIAEILKGEQQ